jgi:nitroreductase
MGLATCPIGLITAFDEDIREQLNLSEDKEVVIGIAVGYRDPSSGVNKVRSARALVNELVKWRE